MVKKILAAVLGLGLLGLIIFMLFSSGSKKENKNEKNIKALTDTVIGIKESKNHFDQIKDKYVKAYNMFDNATKEHIHALVDLELNNYLNKTNKEKLVKVCNDLLNSKKENEANCQKELKKVTEECLKQAKEDEKKDSKDNKKKESESKDKIKAYYNDHIKKLEEKDKEKKQIINSCKDMPNIIKEYVSACYNSYILFYTRNFIEIDDIYNSKEKIYKGEYEYKIKNDLLTKIFNN